MVVGLKFDNVSKTYTSLLKKAVRRTNYYIFKNTHAQNDSVANQLSTSLYGTNDLKLELPDAIKEPSYSSYPEDFPRNKIFSSGKYKAVR